MTCKANLGHGEAFFEGSSWSNGSAVAVFPWNLGLLLGFLQVEWEQPTFLMPKNPHVPSCYS